MKLIFSEYKSDYSNYIFPYAIWAVPESYDTPATIFDKGFLPSSHQLDRFYMCRHVRVDLNKFKPSSENRRIIRKCEGIELNLIPREEFNYSAGWRNFLKDYADKKFGNNVISFARLDSLFNSEAVSHLLLFTDSEIKKDVGLVALYLEDNKIAFYYYAFYDLDYHSRNLGMYMMTSTVNLFAQKQFKLIYLGTCYSHNALYKTQFAGFEFFNGVKWSDNIKELKYLIQREESPIKKHLYETEEFLDTFYDGRLDILINENDFTIC